MSALPLVVSTGDPAGVGPEVALRAALRGSPDERVVLAGDAEQLARIAERRGLPDERCTRLVGPGPWRLRAGQVGFWHVHDVPLAARRCHGPSAGGGRAQLAVLQHAVAALCAGHARALVTAPMSKAAVNLAGVEFVGHTEYLARAAGLADDDVTMLFLGAKLSVALVTTHMSVLDAVGALSPRRVARSACHLAQALARWPRCSRDRPRIGVAALNPHAGEQGLFGDEERRVIGPGVELARGLEPFKSGAARLGDVLPAERVLREALAGRWDGVVTMLHDQATVASKLVDFGRASNVTWGLPFVRTSVDHGVAYDAAAAGEVDDEGMFHALRTAAELAVDQES